MTEVFRRPTCILNKLVSSEYEDGTSFIDAKVDYFENMKDVYIDEAFETEKGNILFCIGGWCEQTNVETFTWYFKPAGQDIAFQLNAENHSISYERGFSLPAKLNVIFTEASKNHQQQVTLTLNKDRIPVIKTPRQTHSLIHYNDSKRDFFERMISSRKFKLVRLAL